MSIARDTGQPGLVIEGDTLSISRKGGHGFFDPRFLLAAVLDYVAQGDGDICDAEAVAMVELIAGHFDLDIREAAARLGHALNLYARSMDLEAVGALLRELLTDAERVDVMWMLLRVVAADGRQGADELSAVDEVAAALQLSDEERHAGFQRYFDEGAVITGHRPVHRGRRSGL